MNSVMETGTDYSANGKIPSKPEQLDGINNLLMVSTCILTMMLMQNV